eukprot:1159931-Pelagomonas_calceolata.AAC.11
MWLSRPTRCAPVACQGAYHGELQGQPAASSVCVCMFARARKLSCVAINVMLFKPGEDASMCLLKGHLGEGETSELVGMGNGTWTSLLCKNAIELVSS